MRILARRQCKIKLQAERALRGFVEGSHVKHVSRQEHARRRVRGPQGRFLGAGEKAEPAKESGVARKTICKDSRATTRAPSVVQHVVLDSNGCLVPPPAPPVPMPSSDQTSDAPSTGSITQRKDAMLASMHAMSQMLMQQQQALKQLEASEEEGATQVTSASPAAPRPAPAAAPRPALPMSGAGLWGVKRRRERVNTIGLWRVYYCGLTLRFMI